MEKHFLWFILRHRHCCRICGVEWPVSILLQSSCFLVPLTTNYFPQHHILKEAHRTFFPQIQNQVLHPYKTTGNIIVLYTLILYFLKANWKTKDTVPNGRRHSLCNFFLQLGYIKSWYDPLMWCGKHCQLLNNFSFFFPPKKSSALTVPVLFHLTSCTIIKSILHFADSLTCRGSSLSKCRTSCQFYNAYVVKNYRSSFEALHSISYQMKCVERGVVSPLCTLLAGRPSLVRRLQKLVHYNRSYPTDLYVASPIPNMRTRHPMVTDR